MHVALFLEEFKPKDIRKRYFSSNNIISNKVQVRLVGYWTIVAKNDKYFVRKTKYGYKYSYLPYFKYATKEEARKKANSVDCKYEFIRTEINLVVTTKILDKIEKSLILK